MLSVMVITRNEEKRIEACLKSVEFADEIIVLDSGSTDNTLEIAKQYTDKVFTNTDWQGYGVQKQRALEYTTGQWVLHLDADERVTPQLKQKLLDVMKANTVDACRVPIQLCFYGKPLRFSSSPTRHARFFRRKGARFSHDTVHEKIVLPQNAHVQQLKAPLLHDSFLDVSHAIQKMDKYSSYSAKIRLDASKTKPFSQSFVGAFWMFIRCYVLQGGFLDGRPGFILACLNAEGSFYRGIKQLYPDQSV